MNLCIRVCVRVCGCDNCGPIDSPLPINGPPQRAKSGGIKVRYTERRANTKRLIGSSTTGAQLLALHGPLFWDEGWNGFSSYLGIGTTRAPFFASSSIQFESSHDIMKEEIEIFFHVTSKGLFYPLPYQRKGVNNSRLFILIPFVVNGALWLDSENNTN